MFRVINQLRSTISKTGNVMPLGRWCHPEYNNKCDIDIKSHLANLDNNYVTCWEKEKVKSHENNMIKFSDPNIK